MNVIIFLHIDIPQKSAEVIVICTFGAHQFKEVSRSKLASVAKSYLDKENTVQSRQDGICQTFDCQTDKKTDYRNRRCKHE